MEWTAIDGSQIGENQIQGEFYKDEKCGREFHIRLKEEKTRDRRSGRR
jgi:hypothetical protein